MTERLTVEVIALGLVIVGVGACAFFLRLSLSLLLLALLHFLLCEIVFLFTSCFIPVVVRFHWVS